MNDAIALQIVLVHCNNSKKRAIFVWMKQYNYIVSLLLAIIVMVISFYPCADRYVSSKVQTESAVARVIETQHSDDAQDACSPFCVCVCCAVSVDLTLPTYDLPVLVQTVSTEKTIVPYPFVESIVYHIWQPPKLV
ncbi:hypothetical protein [Myroides sp. WP-1]|uniref:hypothetical protein n=1 Tax=Myroides sp. WP-1 TaxID=2759944 RepID=UPI0021050786|nr:hypothetical protein [Myroides sp. WP-1]